MTRNNLTPLTAIRMRCLDCRGYNKNEVKECSNNECQLFRLRLGKNPSRKGIGGNPMIATTTNNPESQKSARELAKNTQSDRSKPCYPLKAIRHECLGCMCGQPKEVKLCTSPKCPLFPFRFGRNPSKEEIADYMTHLDVSSLEDVEISKDMNE